MTRIRAHVFVEGTVQGVFFRDSTRKRARELGLGGWVRNLDDGRVEVVFEGERSAVEAALAYVRESPGQSRVLRVDVSCEAYAGEFSDFRVG